MKKIKAVIAEDQPLILKDLCMKIQKADPEIEIAGTAMNGKEAYEKTLSLSPDILITDIRMPVMTGLELIALLKKAECPARTVIISGYKDFDYAREAIKLGVDEYLLKPLSVEDIRFALLSLKERIFMTAQDAGQFTVEELLHSGAHYPANVQTSFHFSGFYLMHIMTGSYPTFPIDYVAPHDSIDKLLPLYDIISPLLAEDESFYLCQGKYYNECICVFCLNDTQKQVLELIARRILEDSRLLLPVTICISRKILHIESIGVESQILRNHIAANLVFSSSGILHGDILSINSQSMRNFLTETDINNYVYLCENHQTHRLHQALQTSLNMLEKNHATQKELEVFFKKLFSHCFSYRLKEDAPSYDLNIDEFLTNSRSYEELLSYLTFFTEQLMKKSDSAAATDSDKLAEAIKKYMDEHFTEDININEIANAFSISPAYFSRLFKKHIGKRPLEYLTHIRICQACKYFTDTDIPVKNIAEMCGYSDPFHFSKVFKNTTGQSPSEYRIQNKLNEGN